MDDDSDSSSEFPSRVPSFWHRPTRTLVLASTLLQLNRTLESAPDEQIAAIDFTKKLEKPIPRDKNLHLALCGVDRWTDVLNQHRFYASSREQARASIHLGEFSSTAHLFLAGLQRIYRSTIMGQHYINSPRGDSTKQFGVGSRHGINCSGVIAALPEVDKIFKTQHAARVQRRLQSVKPFPFLSLPKDIRLMVYDYLLKTKAAILLPTKADDESKEERFSIPLVAVSPLLRVDAAAERFTMSLLAVSQVVHDEAAAVFYGQNTFVVRSGCIDYGYEIMKEAPLIREVGFLVNLNIRYRRTIKRLEWVLDCSHPARESGVGEEDAAPTLLDLLPHLRTIVFLFKLNWSRRLMGQAYNPAAEKRLLSSILRKFAAETRHVDCVGWDFGHCSDFVRGVVTNMRKTSGGLEEVESLHNRASDAVITMMWREFPQFF